MHLSQAKKLKEGQKVVYKNGGRQLTVVRVVPEPTQEFPAGRFPLVVTKEMGAVTYYALRHLITKQS